VRDGGYWVQPGGPVMRCRVPIFADTPCFARGVGESTDVVSKEMYTSRPW